jgi:hypothetical protein
MGDHDHEDEHDQRQQLELLRMENDVLQRRLKVVFAGGARRAARGGYWALGLGRAQAAEATLTFARGCGCCRTWRARSNGP